jgi:hypothetical protein
MSGRENVDVSRLRSATVLIGGWLGYSHHHIGIEHTKPVTEW